MQEKLIRRSNAARTQETRSALISAARSLFLKKGFAETGTPEIVATAKVTRGALYHHFSDKIDLFRTVVEDEAKAVADQISRAPVEDTTAIDALMKGAEMYFSAMMVPGRTRLLLIDGPSILGHTEMSRIDRETGSEELRLGLAAALPKNVQADLPLDVLAELLSAAFDRACLEIADGKSDANYKLAIKTLLTALLD